MDREFDLFGIRSEGRIGADIHMDWLEPAALYRNTARARTSAIADDKVDVMAADVWGELTMHWTDRLRTTFGLRADYIDGQVDGLVAANAGSKSGVQYSPKVNIAYTISDDLEVHGADIAVPAHPHLAAEQERRHRLGLLPQVRGHGHVAFHVLPIAGQFQGMQNHPGMLLCQGLHLGAGLQAVGTAQRPEEIEMDPGRTFRVGRGPGVGRGGQGRAGPADEERQQARQGAGQENSSQSLMHGRALPWPIAEGAPRIDRKRPDESLP